MCYPAWEIVLFPQICATRGSGDPTCEPMPTGHWVPSTAVQILGGHLAGDSLRLLSFQGRGDHHHCCCLLHQLTEFSRGGVAAITVVACHLRQLRCPGEGQQPSVATGFLRGLSCVGRGSSHHSGYRLPKTTELLWGGAAAITAAPVHHFSLQVWGRLDSLNPGGIPCSAAQQLWQIMARRPH